MHTEILDPNRYSLLREITDNICLDDYYMAGGTALSLQLGLRESYDFDFFVPHRFSPESIYLQLKELTDDNIRALNVDNKGTCDVLIRGVQASFFEYPYPLLEDPSKSGDIVGLRLASVRDIATMKAVAIGSRGSRKDFFDLYRIMQRPGYNVSDLIEDLHMKYGRDTNLAYIAMGLGYFDDAEKETLPKTFAAYDWDVIKEYFVDAQKVFIEELDKENDLEVDKDGDPEL